MIRMNNELQEKLANVAKKYNQYFNYNFKLDGRWVDVKNKTFAIILSYNENKDIKEETYIFKAKNNEKTNLENLADSLIKIVVNNDYQLENQYRNLDIVKVG